MYTKIPLTQHPIIWKSWLFDTWTEQSKDWSFCFLAEKSFTNERGRSQGYV